MKGIWEKSRANLRFNGEILNAFPSGQTQAGCPLPSLLHLCTRSQRKTQENEIKSIQIWKEVILFIADMIVSTENPKECTVKLQGR